jgi:hypothetical protein
LSRAPVGRKVRQKRGSRGPRSLILSSVRWLRLGGRKPSIAAYDATLGPDPSQSRRGPRRPESGLPTDQLVARIPGDDGSSRGAPGWHPNPPDVKRLWRARRGGRDGGLLPRRPRAVGDGHLTGSAHGSGHIATMSPTVVRERRERRSDGERCCDARSGARGGRRCTATGLPLGVDSPPGRLCRADRRV